MRRKHRTAHQGALSQTVFWGLREWQLRRVSGLDNDKFPDKLEIVLTGEILKKHLVTDIRRFLSMGSWWIAA